MFRSVVNSEMLLPSATMNATAHFNKPSCAYLWRGYNAWWTLYSGRMYVFQMLSCWSMLDRKSNSLSHENIFGAMVFLCSSLPSTKGSVCAYTPPNDVLVICFAVWLISNNLSLWDSTLLGKRTQSTAVAEVMEGGIMQNISTSLVLLQRCWQVSMVLKGQT